MCDETISLRVLAQIPSGRCVGSQSLWLAKVGEANGGSPAEKGTDDILLWRRPVIDRPCRHFGLRTTKSTQCEGFI
jgi:hypothetical protein